jgi:hypothetical protein
VHRLAKEIPDMEAQPVHVGVKATFEIAQLADDSGGLIETRLQVGLDPRPGRLIRNPVDQSPFELIEDLVLRVRGVRESQDRRDASHG